MENEAKVTNAILLARMGNKMVLPDGSLCDTDGRKTRINNNVIVLGTSGGGKTRSVVIPNILAARESMIIADPKSSLYEECGGYLKRRGFRVLRINLIDPERSDHYNPFACAETSDEVMRLAHLICYSNGGAATGGHGGSYDPFWDRASELLLSALIGFLVERDRLSPAKGNGRNVTELMRLLEMIDANEMEDCGTCEFDKLAEEHQKAYLNERKEESWAFHQWKKFRQTPVKTFQSILIVTNAMLATLDTKGMEKLMSVDDLRLESIGTEWTAVFVETSDTDRSKDLLANVFYGQAMNALCSHADAQPEHRLKVPVRFILDDFGTACRIDNFERMISNVRSRNVSVMIVLQSLSQLEAGYGESSRTIIENCDTLLYMGGNDVDTAKYISVRAAKPVKSILSMPVSTHWQFRREQHPKFCDTVDVSEYGWKARGSGRELLLPRPADHGRRGICDGAL